VYALKPAVGRKEEDISPFMMMMMMITTIPLAIIIIVVIVVITITETPRNAEFFSQGDKERKHGLPVTPILNRSTGHLASSQLAFVTYVTKPMMESLAPILPLFVRMALGHMEVNMQLYQEVIAEGPASRYKTIGVDYAKILAVHGKVTDDMPVEG
jgi:heme/copper-type cytochrome/quinol oxidase subunit 2